MSENCKTCKFFEPLEESIKGKCHRHSPSNNIKGYQYDPSCITVSELMAFCNDDTSIVSKHPGSDSLTPVFYSGWPLVKEDDFCGDYLSK